MCKDRIFWYKTVFLVIILSYATSSVAQQNALSKEESSQFDGDFSSMAPGELPHDVQYKRVLSCTLFGPAEVQGYRVQCSNASFLDFRISDGFIRGDHWSLKGKLWDKAPNTAVTTSPGGVIQYGSTARIYNYGGTSTNPRNLDAYLQCTYLHGVDVFPAGSFILLGSDASNCSVTPDVRRSRIDRMP